MSSEIKIASIIENNWETVKSEMRHTWRKLTDKDVDQINNYQDLVKKLREVYELTEEEIITKIDSFIEKLNLEPNLTRMQELKDALYQSATHMKDKMSQKFNENMEHVQKNAEHLQSVVVDYVKENPLKAVGLGVLAAVAIKKLLTQKT